MIYLENNDVFLFQGDSITHGGRVFSDWDMNHIIGHGYQDYIAQRLGVDNIDRNPEIVNRGVSGDNVYGMTARLKADFLDLKPTAMSILSGTNDASLWLTGKTEHTPAAAINMYRNILESLRGENPDIKLIICQPFRYLPEDSTDKAHDQKGVDYVNEMKILWEQAAKDYDAIFVRFADVLDPYVKRQQPKQVVWDGIHPTYVGHGILAECWLETVEKEWKNL